MGKDTHVLSLRLTQKDPCTLIDYAQTLTGQEIPDTRAKNPKSLIGQEIPQAL